ncbi:DEAD/DEAH box helicase [Acinetobacter guillouiae]|uniref:DEAD/DEAH box helicase n=1 Tax=Acinetobacter guillouiae TaxID=106649 RepID=UPI001AE305B5|nr:DEAD/DEAH box helicase family protein [Acinetobacter guillouiae]MBP2544948.1 superfamily II DNA or RNA helicase [Acinetobacter guillouiae]
MINQIDVKILAGLRDCQKRSIEVIDKYIRSHSTGSCLVSLPTGAGKSGVICTVGHYVSLDKILIITHRRAVCDQLYKQLKGKFFEKILSEKTNLKPYLIKKVFKDIADPSEKGIYCTTFQMLMKLKENELEALKNNFNLILIDEGHAEPSPKWGATVRELKAKKVIITATPYRNDLFSFDIDVNHSYIYTYKFAISDKVIVSPKFEKIREEEVFATLDLIKKNQPNSKCIIKCKEFSDIEKYFKIFSEKFKTIAIHQQFEKKNLEHRFSDVPSKLAELDYEVLIHQRKLDEGIDIPEAKILILTYPVGSGKELVQTIGRVVRIYDNYEPTVIEFDGTNNKNLWKNYQEFDEYISNSQSAKRFLNTLNTSSLIESYLEAFPEHSYFESGYRKKFNFQQFDPLESLEIPLASVCFYYKLDGFNIYDCLDKLNWELMREGALSKISEDLGVITAVCFNNSKFLKDSLFFEPSLEIMIVKELNDIIAIYDSRGRKFNGRDDLKIGRTIDVDKLFSVVSNSNNTVVTKQANTRALQYSPLKADGVLLKGINLEKINQAQSNSSYAVTTAVVSGIGQDDKVKCSYYLGVASGRICDQKHPPFSYQQFIDWLDIINLALNSNQKTTSNFLNSFAQVIDIVPSDDPIACQLDFSDKDLENIEIHIENVVYKIDDEIIYRKYYNSGLMLQTGYCPTNHNKIFRMNSNFLIKFTFDKTMNLIPIMNPNVKFMCNGIYKKKEEIFNSNTVILLYKNGTTYMNGNFYKVQIPTDTQKLNPNIIKNLISLSCLQHIDLDEKDEKNLTQTYFGQNSIFYLIDQLSNIHKSNVIADLGDFYSYIPDIDLILCTDMDTEPADFILSSPSKVVFVHVKCGDAKVQPYSSAGAICEVGGQALKNLHWLIHSGRSKYANTAYLNQQWPRKSGSKPNKIHLNTRIRLFDKKFDLNHNLDDVIKIIDERRLNPLVDKEIWIVVGNAFSKEHFVNQFQKGITPSPESVQAYQLLDTWFNQASSNNVDLRVFVSK